MLKKGHECLNKLNPTLTWGCLCVLFVIWAQFVAFLGRFRQVFGSVLFAVLFLY